MFGNEFNSEVEVKRELELEGIAIKRAILESAANSKDCPIDLANNLITAFERINQHYSACRISDSND